MLDLEDRPAARPPSKPFSGRSLAISATVHVVVLGVLLFATKVFTRTPEVIVPIDMTIVPPWAEQTDDPEPDPNPPPKPEPPKPKPKPQPKPEPKPEPVKNVEAVEKVVEKKKPEKPDLRKNAKLVKESPKPQEPLDLRKNAKKIDMPVPKLPPGKATAAEKPLSPEEIRRLLEQGYTYGSKNQLATSEAQRCVSIIAQAIRREWDKESFKWYPGLSPIQVMLQFGPGGSIRGFRILSGSGDPDVDRTAQSALRRLGRISGLSASFLEQFAEIAIEMKPVAGG